MKLSEELKARGGALAEIVPSQVPVTLDLTLCGEAGLEFRGQRFVPNPTRGYFQFACCHAFPNSIAHGEAFHPAVIARSYETMLHQNVNYEHQLAEYHKGQKDVRDRIIGSILAVDFPGGPNAQWAIQSDPEKAPGISGVGVIYKQAQGTAKIFGEHQMSRRKFTVSMEVLWPREEAGYAVELNGGAPLFAYSPTEFIAAGWEYIPPEKAPAELQACWSEKKHMIISRYRGRKVLIMPGGITGSVHYAGIGIVSYGAERAAKLTRLVASGQHPLSALADDVGSRWKTLAKK